MEHPRRRITSAAVESVRIGTDHAISKQSGQQPRRSKPPGMQSLNGTLEGGTRCSRVPVVGIVESAALDSDPLVM